MRWQPLFIVVGILLVFLCGYLFHLKAAQQQYEHFTEVVNDTLDRESERLLKLHAHEPQIHGGTSFVSVTTGDLLSTWSASYSYGINHTNENLDNIILITCTVMTELTWNGPIRVNKLHIFNIRGSESASFISALEKATGYKAICTYALPIK